MSYAGSICYAGSLALAAGLMFTGPAFAQNQINTFAGNGQAAYSGDGGMAINAALNYPKGVAIDPDGNIYVADTMNSRVRKVSPSGMITTVAGNGINAYSGDGGLAIAASLSDVTGVAVDGSGNLYITDDSNRRIRKVGSGGIITTIAGVGVQGYSGDGGPATAAMLGRAVALAFDPSGNLYYADSVNQVVRKIDRNGIITTVAGNGIEGFSGDGGPATAASMAFPIGIAIDQSGNLYIADGNNNRIRKVAGGIITTIAGNGTGGFAGDGGQAINGSLNIPSDVAVDGAGNVYIADAGNNRVRMVTPGGVLSTVAGTDNNGYSGDGGPPAQAMLNFPWGLSISPNGTLYIGDRVNSRIRAVSGQAVPTVSIPTLANGTPVVNGASFAAGMPIAPGAIVSIFGQNLAPGTATYLNAPLPLSLDTSSVLLNGSQTPLFFVSKGQINIQVPFNTPLGQMQIQVRNAAGASAPFMVPVAQFSPGIFVMDYNTNTGAVVHTSNYALVNAGNPAKPGETLAVFATGLGPINMPLAAGVAAPSTAPFALTVATPAVTIGGLAASVPFSGLAPGFVGLYQLNITVPAGLSPGTYPLLINLPGVASNSVSLAIGQ